jgi:glycogen synthase
MTADPVGGVWTYMLELVRGLVAAEVEVVVASLGGPVSAEQRSAFDRIGPRAKLLADHRRLEWMDQPWEDVASSGEWLLALEEEHRPDLIHLNGYAHGSLPFRAPVVIAAHSCVFSWWRAVHRCSPPPEWQRYHEAVACGLRSVDLVVAPSEAMLSSLVVHYGVLPSARVIPNGRSPLPSPGLPRENAILGVGRLWDEAKNLRALATLAPQLSWPVRLAGATRAPDGFEVALPGVKLLGVLSEPSLGEQLDRASIFAAPARYEPFGLSILEAAHAGCALVLGDIPSLR